MFTKIRLEGMNKFEKKMLYPLTYRLVHGGGYILPILYYVIYYTDFVIYYTDMWYTILTHPPRLNSEHAAHYWLCNYLDLIEVKTT